MGFVFRFYNLISNLTALENVEIAAQLCKTPILAQKALDMVGLSERTNNFPAQLSGGEQQRANARINQQIAPKLKVPAERFPQNIRLRGNISAASIPVLLDESNRAGKISYGSIVVLAEFDAGLTWGSCVLTWR